MSKAEGPIQIWVKPKVLAGFTIILAFAIASISITYNGFTELLKTRQSLSHPNKKLVTLNSALADIYEAESNIRAYNLSQNEDYLNYYFSFLLKINDKVDTLLYLTKDNSSQKAKIKTIKQLLEKKAKVLDEFIDLKKNDRSSVFYDKALEEIAKVQSIHSAKRPLVARTTTTTTSKKDTIVERMPNQKAGFFGKIKNWISGKEKVDTLYTKVRVETRIDTIIRSGYVTDSVMRNVVGILNQIKSEQENARDLAGLKELELLKSDKELMDQIRVIVSLLEREELSQSYKRANSAEEVVHKSTIIVLALGGAALIMLLLFVAVIFRDITKGNYYRNELYESKKYAEKLLKVKEQFLANMSHEIRTPLSSIIGLSRQIEKTELNSRQSDYIKLLTSSSNHLLSVINDILDFSKIEAGQMRIESLPFNLSEVVQESLNTLMERAKEKGISLEKIEENSENLTIWGDPFRLKQILLNLLSNAIKFTDQGSVSIISSYSEINSEFVRVNIAVKDTGIGINPEQQSLIFEEFTQADPSTTRRFGGTGLGLTIVKKLTELQGGEVGIQSQVNVGTTITISIPYRLKGELAERTEELVKPIAINQNVRVLIIDDDDINGIISVELFKNLGIAADSTNDPSKVLDLITNHKYQIVFTDIHMPEISGYDIVEKVKNLDESIPVIAITANSMIDNPNHFIEKGFSGYLIKPYTEVELIKILEPFIMIKKEMVLNLDSETNTDLGYDLTDIFRFSGGDKQSAKLILSTFLENTDKNLIELNGHIHRKDLKNCAAIAHKMKSAFKQFKVYNIAGLLLKIEKIEDKKENMHEAKELIEELNIQIKPVVKSLRKELAKLDFELKG
jgi:signal transduction histidine kinase/AmiR/NasT family two-component response regulator/HPt (histidine-containing phosphotransfer) domain-containing protein